jgi:HK97 family phage prohead protease
MMQVISSAAAASARRAAAESGPLGLSQMRSGSGPLVREARSVSFPAQCRALMEERDGQNLYHLTGIASVTNKPYEMHDVFGPYNETVDRGAFDETLGASPDVAFLVNHRGVTMARTTNGTLALRMTDTGLLSDAWLNPKRQDVSDLVTAIEDRNIDQMSFAFMLEEGLWNDDFTEFRIMRVNIDRGDVSAVNYGANPYTSIAARSQEILQDIDRMPVGFARAAMARLSDRDDLAAAVAEPTGMDLAGVSAWLTQHS